MILLSALWLPGTPAGADTWGHLFRAEYLAEAMDRQGPSAYFRTAWMPAWYMGDPFLTYYPPLTALALTPFVYLAGSGVLGLKLFLSLALGAFSLAAYVAIYALWGRWPAGFGAVLVLLSPYQMRTTFFEGNLPRMLSLLALPILLVGTEKVLTTSRPRLPWVGLLSAAWAWAILAHPQQAYLYGIGLSLYLVFRLFLDPDLPLVRAIPWLGGALIGLILSAPWALAAYGRGELANVPNLPVEKVALFTAPAASLVPRLNLTDGTVALGFGILLLALLAAASRPDPRRTALVVTGLVCFVLSLGPAGVVYSLLPLQAQLLPERFLNFTAFALPVAAAGIVPIRSGFRWARLFVIGSLVLLDLAPALGLIRHVRFQAQDLELQAAVAGADVPDEARWILFSDPEPRAAEVYLLGQQVTLANGWALENTPHHETLRRYLTAAEWSSDYLASLLGRWAVGGAVVQTQADPATAAGLSQHGWHRVERVGDFELWQDGSPPSPVQALPDRRLLVLGDSIAPILMAFPFGQEAEAKRLAALDPGAIAGFPALALYRFADPTSDLGQEQAILTDYLEAGGNVIVDLSGMEQTAGRSTDFLGVSVLSLSFSQEMALRWHGLETMPDSLPLPEGVDGWSAATYRGLDGVVAEVALDETWYPFLGYKQFGAGRAWFVGLNLLYYAQLTQSVELAQAIQQLTLDGVDVDRSLSYAALPVKDWQAGGRGLSFGVAVPEPAGPALVAYTYSPRFRAYVDGQPIGIESFEHLMVLDLPAGSHQVVIEYLPFGTGWPVAGWLVGGLGLLGLVAATIVEQRRYLPPAPVPAHEPVVSDRSHAPCANCGFLLSEVGPPSAVTYPFQVVHCPICGLSMGDEGFSPGEELDAATRQARLAAWLRQQDYDPETVHERWGFSAEAFFSGEGELPHLPDIDRGRHG